MAPQCTISDSVRPIQPGLILRAPPNHLIMRREARIHSERGRSRASYRVALARIVCHRCIDSVYVLDPTCATGAGRAERTAELPVELAGIVASRRDGPRQHP